MTSLSVTDNRPILPTARQRVLVVDDEIAILFAYRKLIETEGLEVDACDNLEEAMDMIRNRPYLAIITDMRLEGSDNEDGIELLHLIREIQPDARVIVVTGYGSEELKHKTQTLGAMYYFEKPVLSSAIMTAIKTRNNAA
jgi:DNA-binding NtrC family response regulator